jgi:DNA-binding CsgD family transcriptional regulator
VRKVAEASGRLFLVGPRSKTLEPPVPRDSEPPLEEIVIDGRRYRLVPADTAPPEATRETVVTKVLTARELQIAALVAEGLVNKQIAAELGISEWTVSTHLRRIFAKLDVETRAAMVSKCFDALAQRD